MGAAAALLLAVVVVAVVLLGNGSDYTVKANLQNASQLVRGNLVQVAGEPVGKVEDIELTDDSQARVTFTVDDRYAPLKRGTIAVVRQASLSGIANRYIDLQQGPATGPDIENGATIPAENTESVVDIDQLFQAFDPPTREALRTDIEGFADMTEGRTEEARAALLYLNPVMSASSRFFNELSRNDAMLERFVVQTSQLMTDVAGERESLSGIVRNFGAVSTTLAQRDAQLAESIERLPGFMRKANTTFVNLRATLDDLDPLVAASRPVVRRLRPLLADLRPFARDAAPTVRDLSRTIRRPGKDNDLVELLRLQPAVRQMATGPVQANGRERRGALPELAQSLRDSTPQLAFFRPYAPDLLGWFDDFSHSGAYDALGGFSRAGLAFSAFTFTPGLPDPVDPSVPLPDLPGAPDELELPTIVPVPPELRDEVLALNSDVNRNNRCPGSVERSIDGSNPYKPTPDFNCDESQRPLGP